jgi:choline dehydrogenase-like flavoprotein
LGAQAGRILVKGGKASGVEFYTKGEGGFKKSEAEAELIIVSAGAIESARLLFLSAHGGEPEGIGNRHGLLGRNLQGHYYAGAMGYSKEPLQDCKGPGVSIATLQFAHGNEGVIGGALLANEFVPLPSIYWRNAFAEGQRRWGAQAKRFLRDGYRRFVQVQGPIQEIPNPDCRITLDAKVKDRLGLPVARLSGSLHPETQRTAAVIQKRAAQWLKEAGVEEIRLSQLWNGLSAGQHQAGTCRMGEDPKTSVCDTWGRVHGHENLYVLDASLHPTNGAFNPVLTIMALAFRSAERL